MKLICATNSKKTTLYVMLYMVELGEAILCLQFFLEQMDYSYL